MIARNSLFTGLVRLLALLSLVLAGYAQARCSAVQSGTLNLGSPNSFAVRSTPQQTSGWAGLQCGSLAAFLTSDYIRATVTTTNNMVLKASDGTTIPYQLSMYSSFNPLITNGQMIDASGGVFLDLLGLFGSGRRMPLYLRTTTGVNVPAGVYTDTVTVKWDYNVCEIGVFACVLRSSGTVNSTLPVVLIVTKDCINLTAPNVNFGQTAFPATLSPVSQFVQVSCTKTEGYVLKMDMGDNSTGGWRRMHNGSGQYIRYNLYQNSGSTVWNLANSVAAVGDGYTQSFNYQARVAPTQPNVPAGTYTDYVRLVVEY